LLVDPFFFDPTEWIPVPKSWAKNIERGQGPPLRSQQAGIGPGGPADPP